MRAPTKDTRGDGRGHGGHGGHDGRRGTAGTPGRETSSAPKLPDTTLLGGAIACLLVIGLVMTFSASFVTSSQNFGGPYAIFLQHGQSVLLGGVALFVCTRVDHRLWRRAALPLLGLALVLCALVLIPGIGVEVGGARRWLAVGPLQFQPAELLKLALPLAIGDLVCRRWRQLQHGDLQALLVPAVPLILVSAGLVFASPDLESAALVAVIGIAVLFTAGLPWRLVGVGGVVVGAVGLLGLTLRDFRGGRIAAWLDPFADPANYGFQTVQGYYALGSGGWLGAGLGASRSKWLFLPNPHTDFIFAIIGEELGLVGTLTVLVLFAVLAVAATRIARAANDPFGRLAAVGIATWILLQAAINMGSVVGLLPVTGVTLPLVSYGGTSLIVTMAGLGILLSIGNGAAEGRVHDLTAADAAGARAAGSARRTGRHDA